jgi:GNAT superfamily N-acetyltransferase
VEIFRFCGWNKWEFQRTAFEEYVGVQDPPPGILRASLADVEQSLRDGGGLLAYLGDAAVGSIVWSYRGPVFYVQHVAVHPAYRRRGLASRMMVWRSGGAARGLYPTRSADPLHAQGQPGALREPRLRGHRHGAPPARRPRDAHRHGEAPVRA